MRPASALSVATTPISEPLGHTPAALTPAEAMPIAMAHAIAGMRYRFIATSCQNKYGCGH
jgi:hypothetical protein